MGVMEVVLNKAGDFPAGAVLSLKVGDTKRQAPVWKSGQAFRFTPPPIYPVAVQAEVLVPVATSQQIFTWPDEVRNADDSIIGKDAFVLDFGSGMEVSLSVRHDVKGAPELSAVQADVLAAGEAKGMPPDKLRTAQEAAAYLEEHDIIRSFQEILRALIVEKPADPQAFVRERMTSAGAPEYPTPNFPTASSGEPAEVKEPGATSTLLTTGTPTTVRDFRCSFGKDGLKKSIRMEQRENPFVAQSKVDTLLVTLQSAQENVAMVLPFLPENLQNSVGSQEFAKDCLQQFKELDVNNAGRLSPPDLIPLIRDLAKTGETDITEAQCRNFVDMFDSDGDGLISMEDFTYVVQFVIIASFLDSEEGRRTVEMAQVQDTAFNDFIAMIEADKERLWTILPFLPEWLVRHVTSAEFHSSCTENFDSLDVNRNGSLEPDELISVIQTLSEAHPLTIDIEKCRRFTALFNSQGNGFIMKDEFIEFAQFITVMNFLSTTVEGRHLRKRADLMKSGKKTLEFLAILEEEPSRVDEVLQGVSKSLAAATAAEDFQESVWKTFQACDVSDSGLALLVDLVPQLSTLCERFAFSVSQEDVAVYTAKFNKSASMSMSQGEFMELVKYVLAMGYLQCQKVAQEKLEAEVNMGRESIDRLLLALREGVEQISDIIPFLPRDFLDKLFTEEFAHQCSVDFQDLDVNSSGVLEPMELLTIIMNMVEAHDLCLTDAHARQFVDIFDAEGNGVITPSEFTNFVRFMMIMAFTQTEDGKKSEEMMELTHAQQSVEALLKMLEQDRKAIHKVVPLLPPDIYTELTSNRFITSCHDKFIELDKDKTGVLRPTELYSVVAELSATQLCNVTETQCERFTAIFDMYGDGVLRPEEFLDFSRFLCIMSYLHTDDGKVAVKDALRIMTDSKNIEELLDAMQSGRKDLHMVIPYLPAWLQEDVLSQRFAMECVRYFQELDKDDNGVLDPEELFPMVLSLSQAHTQSLDLDQCRRFTAIFDGAKRGVITKAEFVEFARFLVVMGYLQSQEGQQVMQSALAERHGHFPLSMEPTRASFPELPRVSDCDITAPALQIQACDFIDSPACPNSPAHLAVDCDFYLKKSQRLANENEELRTRLQDIESMLRRTEMQLEEQGRTLRHAEVDLRANGPCGGGGVR